MPQPENLGRPSSLTPELADEICRRLSAGESYAHICRDAGMPDFSTIWRWEQRHPEFRSQARLALQQGCHSMAHQCIAIADDTGLAVQNRRLMIETRLKLIGKWHRKAYGDHVQVDHMAQLRAMSDAELEATIKAQLAQLAASGLNVRELLPELD